MQTSLRMLEESLDDVMLLLQAPEYLEYEDQDLEQDLRHEIVLCESAASILARMRLAALLQSQLPPAPYALSAVDQPFTQRVAARQDEVQPWDL